MPTDAADVVVVGAGVVGAATAWYATQAGLSVTVVDRGAVAGGTTGAGEGNILVSDKPPGAELDLARFSSGLWRELGHEVGGFEYDPKGGLVVASTPAGFAALRALAAEQSAAGVATVVVPAAELAEHEPHLTPSLAGGVLYPEDAQVQPMLAAARLLRSARAKGARVRTGLEVTGFLRHGDRVTGVRTSAGDLPAGVVVNAAGTWGGEVAALAGVDVPVLPRRGFILVTEPLPRIVRHKVYAAEYVSDVASSDAALQTSPVVEGTESGTILIGASRERVGYDRTLSVEVLRALAAQAVALFPVLAGVQVIRAYRGFRPYCPDHLPVIGPDPRAPGLYHACGHEGAGIGLAAATGRLIAQLIGGDQPELDVAPFRPERFDPLVTA
ncbi:FAD-binding oxidoreductase [Jiangella ureilytica]|uniref:FAD-binding oxidoreductase n=1 Tax=Jiangella ureilytica TaxID=2530374 RepID=A0A4V2XW83_9ACTN|nr:FAD-binding oxidoreductase [Jiangella ureilytica]TDC48235.1 FAD-binding oxidoreductase [Jiangella ureilytica]